MSVSYFLLATHLYSNTNVAGNTLKFGHRRCYQRTEVRYSPINNQQFPTRVSMNCRLIVKIKIVSIIHSSFTYNFYIIIVKYSKPSEKPAIWRKSNGDNI